jgi:hypothetical protein
MSFDFDEFLARLKRAPTDRPLAGLEARVWTVIRSQQRSASPALIWGWRSAAAAAVMTAGILIQASTVAHASSELALFTSRPALAPSTLLGETR